MSWANKLIGFVTGNGVEVTADNALKVTPERDAFTNPGNVGGIRSFSEVDQGLKTGLPLLLSPEADNDFRVRVSQDLVFDDEVFNYTAQNTGKHQLNSTTMAATFTAGQFTTNSGSITTITTGVVLQSYASFPKLGTQTISADFEAAFSAQPQANSFIEFGQGVAGAQTVAPTDGVFFRLNSSGLQGIASFNGAEVSTGVFPLSNGTGVWAYTNAKRYQFICYETTVGALFWVNDGAGTSLLGTIPLPAGQSRMTMARSGQIFFKHRITGGAAGGVLQGALGAYNLRIGGSNASSTVSTQGNRIYGSYQGVSGGTMGTLARVGTITTGNEANVAAAVPTTTTAALGSGLGGTFWETVSLAVNTDGIIMSFQVPALTVNSGGQRLVLRGIALSSYVQTVIVGGPYVAEWFLAFGHTAVSLATVEAATTKAPRRVALPFNQIVTAAQAVNTAVAQSSQFMDFGDAPIFVNPGEFIQLCTRHLGTAGTSGTIVHRVVPVYGWE